LGLASCCNGRTLTTSSEERQEILKEVERIRQIYAELRRRPTRRVELLGRKCDAQVLYTFLGFEVKMGRKRLTCPDVVSARYLCLFAELGMPDIRIPYDPTHTRLVLAGLEPALDRIKELLLEEKVSQKTHQRAVRRVYKRLREALLQEDGGEV